MALADVVAGTVQHTPPKRVRLEVELPEVMCSKLFDCAPLDTPEKGIRFRALLLDFFNDVDLDAIQFRAVK